MDAISKADPSAIPNCVSVVSANFLTDLDDFPKETSTLFIASSKSLANFIAAPAAKAIGSVNFNDKFFPTSFAFLPNADSFEVALFNEAVNFEASPIKLTFKSLFAII